MPTVSRIRATALTVALLFAAALAATWTIRADEGPPAVLAEAAGIDLAAATGDRVVLAAAASRGALDAAGNVRVLLAGPPGADPAGVGTGVPDDRVVHRDEFHGGIVALSVPAGHAGEVAAAAYDDPTVDLVELSRTVEHAGEVDDPRFTASDQFGLVGHQLALPWQSDLGGFDVDLTIAILDTGVNSGTELPSGRITGGYNATNDSGGWSDFDKHGTASAVVAAAETGNGVGGAGACPTCTIMPVRVFTAPTPPSTDPVGTSEWVASGIFWAVDNGADIISMSLSAGSETGLLASAVGYADDNDVLMVAAAGNEGTIDPRYPAANDLVIGVAASTQQGNRASFSSHGDWADLAASVCNWSADADHNGYLYCGTSSSTPLVAGAIAAFTSYGSATVQEAAAAFKATAEDASFVDYGIVDGAAAAAMLAGDSAVRAAVRSVASSDPCLDDGSCDGAPLSGATVTFSASSPGGGTTTDLATVTSGSDGLSDPVDLVYVPGSGQTFTVDVDADGHSAAARDFTPVSGGTRTVTVVLVADDEDDDRSGRDPAEPSPSVPVRLLPGAPYDPGEDDDGRLRRMVEAFAQVQVAAVGTDEDPVAAAAAIADATLSGYSSPATLYLALPDAADGWNPAAVAAGSAAAVQGGAVAFLAADGTLPPTVLWLLEQHTVSQVVLLGDEQTIPAATAGQLDAHESVGGVRRVAGEDRYATAAQLAGSGQDPFGYDRLGYDRVYLAAGDSYPDTLVAAMWAARSSIHGDGGPAAVLLTDGDELSEPAAEALREIVGDRARRDLEVRIVGGRDAVAGSVGDTLAVDGFQVVRVWGPDRYLTAMGMGHARDHGPYDDPTVFLASGQPGNPVDQVAVTLAGQHDAVPLLGNRSGQTGAVVPEYLQVNMLFRAEAGLERILTAGRTADSGIIDALSACALCRAHGLR